MQSCLIVDDSSVICKVAGRIIFQLGFEVECANSGEEALALLGDTLPDVVIVSGALADPPSDEFIRTLRAMPTGSEPVILASLVEANLGQMTRLKRAGATGFIYKPFDRNSLTEWLTPYCLSA